MNSRQRKAMFARMRRKRGTGDVVYTGSMGRKVQTGTSDPKRDRQRSAKYPGRRLSASGNKYSEYRRNRSDAGRNL